VALGILAGGGRYIIEQLRSDLRAEKVAVLVQSMQLEEARNSGLSIASTAGALEARRSEACSFEALRRELR